MYVPYHIEITFLYYRTRLHIVGPNKYIVKGNSATSVENDWMIIYPYIAKVRQNLCIIWSHYFLIIQKFHGSIVFSNVMSWSFSVKPIAYNISYVCEMENCSFAVVCEYFVHIECQDFAVADCKENATYLPGKDLAAVRHTHHWREGNLPSSSKCAACKKGCCSAECLSGFRCEWCGMTVKDISNLILKKHVKLNSNVSKPSQKYPTLLLPLFRDAE